MRPPPTDQEGATAMSEEWTLSPPGALMRMAAKVLSTENHGGTAGALGQPLSPADDDDAARTVAIDSWTMRWPSLSLRHEKGDLSIAQSSPGTSDATTPWLQQEDRYRAERQAASLLARPLERCMSAKPEADCHGRKEWLHNIVESFQTLVESRIRAYSVVIAKQQQGRTVPTSDYRCDQEQFVVSDDDDRDEEGPCPRTKRILERLSQVAESVQTMDICTRWELPAPQIFAENDNTSLTLVVAFHLRIPEQDTPVQPENLKLQFRTRGEFQVISSTVEIVLDTHQFLAGLVEQASHVVDTIILITSPPGTTPTPTSTTTPRSITFHRSASYLQMPPPPPQPRIPPSHNVPPQEEGIGVSCSSSRSSCCTRSSMDTGLELLCNAAELRPIVSPGIYSCHIPEDDSNFVMSIPLLDLKHHHGHDDLPSFNTANVQVHHAICCDSDEEDEEDFSLMSIDQCEDIVDSVFGDVWDDNVLFGSTLNTQRNHPRTM